MSKMSELMQKLQQDGVSEDQIAVILAEIAKAASLKLYTQLVNAIDDNDRELLEETADKGEDEQENLLEALYQKYYDTTPDQAVTDLQEQFAETFLENYDLAAIKNQK